MVLWRRHHRLHIQNITDMKKNLLFALVLFIALPSMAQLRSHQNRHPGQATLTVISTDRHGFWLFVDDVLQNERPVHSICVRNFWDDNFHIRVELDNRLHNCVGQYVDMSHSRSLNIAQYDGLYGLDFTEAHIRPELTMDLISALPIATQEAPVVVPIEPTMPPTPPMPNGMNPKDYDEAFRMISNQSYDNTKLTTAKQVISNNPMTVNQIANICKLFSFENNKLEFAKYAYSFCTEKNKYYMLNEVFDYDSSKHELNEYIQGL